MKKVSIANPSGFCFGVDRAVKLVYKELDKGSKVATLGPIIHNQDVVNDMNKRGARIIENVDELEDDEVVIIRSHGVEKQSYDQIKARGNMLVDATCPFVSRIHKIVEEKVAEDYFVLIAGDENHPEVQGIISYCNKNYFVFKDNLDLKYFFEKKYENLKKRLAIVAQTTYNIIIWGECLKVIPENDPNVVVFDTICNATEERQSAAEDLAKKVGIMFVIGGKHSSNTIKLFDVCKKYCNSYHIENVDELSSLDLPFTDAVGITAGASTPAHIIKEVFTTMTEILNNLDEKEENFEELLEQSFKKIHTGEKVKAIVERVGSTEITVSLGTKHTGYVSLNDLTADPSLSTSDVVSVGDEIDLIVVKVNDQEGTVTLSKRRVDEQAGFEKILKAKEEDTVLEGTVQAVVKGGVTVYCFGVRVFIPASQTGLPRNADLNQLVKKKIEFKIIEVNENRRRSVGSMKAIVEAERAVIKAKFWETANVGDTFTGKVKSITNFGAFVDLGGIDGMVHISELSWKRIKNPNDVVSIGDTLEVYIKDLNQEKDRISLGYKKTEDNPWVIFENNYNVGDIVKATIVSITTFGAFAQIIDGIDGLIHISQIANQKVENVKDILSVGQEVDVKITAIDMDAKKISLSMRELAVSDEEVEDAE